MNVQNLYYILIYLKPINDINKLNMDNSIHETIYFFDYHPRPEFKN